MQPKTALMTKTARQHLTLLLTVALSAILLLAAAAPARAQAPGTLDSLNAAVVGSNVFATAVQADGKIIIAGNFTSVLGIARHNIARLNINGTLDMGFDPNAGSIVNTVAVQADGRVLLGGQFITLQPNGAASPTTSQSHRAGQCRRDAGHRL